MEFMKRNKRILIWSTAGIFGLFLCIYLGILFILPNLLNSNTFIKKMQGLISKNTGYNVVAENFNIKITPALSLNLRADKISAKKNGVNILDIEGFSGKTSFNKLKEARAEYLFLNFNKIQKTTKKGGFKATALPDIYLESAEIIFDETKEFKGKFSNFSIKKIDRKKYIKFYGEISSIFLKDKLILGENGYLFADKNSIFAKQFEILSKNSLIQLNGKIYDEKGLYDFYLKGKDISAQDLTASVLYLQKAGDPSKKFIENFYNYSGEIDINLNFRNDGIFGKCSAKKLAAVTVLFNAPVYFENADFYFDKTTVKSRAEGELANEKITHSLYITNILSPERFTKGRIEANLQNNIDKFIPGLKTIGKQKICVEYYTKNKKTAVDYLLNLQSGADIFYKNASLGLKHKDRRLSVHTIKHDNFLHIKNYDYSILNNGETLNIVSGKGLFTKIQDKMKPKYLTSKTNGFAPSSVAGSFGRFISGGEFSGNLKYDFQRNKIFGNFIIKNAHHKDFFVKKAEINADKKCVNILAEGKYRGEKFTSKMSARNKIGNKIIVYNMDLFLDKYTTKPSSTSLKLKSYKYGEKYRHLSSRVKDIDLTVENWKIKTSKIIKDKIVLNNVSLTGSLKNHVFRFSTSDIYFAKGTLSAMGLYDFKKNSSLLRFRAKNVDSDIATNLIFGLNGQVKGIADAVLYIKTFKKFDDIKAKVVFKIDKGYLPKLGETEITNKLTRRKIKLSRIVNIKDNENNPINPSELASDIKGSFYMDNHLLKDLAVTSRQKHLSLLFEGEYDIDSENTDLMIFGKYNNSAQRKVKILFMPLSFVTKLIFRPEHSFENYKAKFEKVPDINTKSKDTSLFRVKIQGSPKENNLNVEMKRIY